jgi:hypothetical protein
VKTFGSIFNINSFGYEPKNQVFNARLGMDFRAYGGFEPEIIAIGERRVRLMYNFLKSIFGINNSGDQEVGSFDEYRVSWHPEMAKPGDTIHIDYQGLLKDSGAKEVYLHYGFDSWSKKINTVKMENNDYGGFETDIHVDGNHEINFCFKDDANHWDNNDGFNWTVPLQ